MIRGLIALATVALIGLQPVAKAELPSPRREVSIYFSPGSSNGRGDLAPLNSAAAIDDVFASARKNFGVKRVLWRGLQEEDYAHNQVFRSDNLAVSQYWKWSRHLSLDLQLNRHAVQEAHRLGMSIWGYTSLFEYGAQPREAVYGAMNSGPVASEAKIRVHHPEWIPVDRHGIRRQSGPLEFAYPGARKALKNELVQEVLRYDYDGLMLVTYVEITDLWFEDEFGFSEPIVKEFKRRYGVDIRTQPFDIVAWRKLRGEYVTTFLRELATDLHARGKKLGIAIDPRRPALAQPWAGSPQPIANAGSPQPIANAGSQEIDWRAYIDRSIVDEIMIGSPDGAEEFANQLETVRSRATGGRIAVSVLGHPASVAKVLGLKTPGDCSPIISASVPGFEAELAAAGDTMPGGVLARRRHLSDLVVRGPASLAEIEGALNDPEDGVRCAAVMALAKINGPETAAKIFAAIAARSNYQFDSCAAQALAKMGEDQTPALVLGLTAASAAVRRAASAALSQGIIRSGALPALLQAVGDSDPLVRFDAVMALPRFKDQSVFSGLLRAFDDKHPTVRNAAAFALGQALAGNGEQNEAALTLIQQRLLQRFSEFNSSYRGRDAGWGFRTAGEALVNMGPRGQSALLAILKNSPDRRLADYAWRCLYLPPSPLTNKVNSLEEAEGIYALHSSK